jgi:hypothetical protein
VELVGGWLEKRKEGEKFYKEFLSNPGVDALHVLYCIYIDKSPFMEYSSCVLLASRWPRRPLQEYFQNLSSDDSAFCIPQEATISLYAHILFILL